MKSTTLIVASIVVAAMFAMPAAAVVFEPTNVKYFHTSLDPLDPPYPFGQNHGMHMEQLSIGLHELYPNYCDEYTLTSWYDNNPGGVLSPCDVIDITDADGEVTYWHVEEVTITIAVNEAPNTPVGMYLDYVGDRLIDVVLYDPIGPWHEIWPTFCQNYTIVDWDDTGDAGLGWCDWILLMDEETSDELWWHVEEVTIDIVVKKMCLGECYLKPDCEGDMTGVMLCWQCLGRDGVGGLGASWKPTVQCPGRDLHCPDCCYNRENGCPACCDGKDNDNDGAIDCPDDLGCACCCDETEDANESVPCVPELATFAMFGVGLLLIVGIGMRRRE